MKRLLILALVLLSVGCTESTKFGKCVGINPDDRDPNLRYEISGNNVVVGIIFFEMIAPPVVVFLNELYCPVGPKR